MKQKASSEQPVKDALPLVYERGATRANNEPLEKDENYATSDSNLQQQKEEAHQTALRKETEHYEDMHREGTTVEKTEPQNVSEPPSSIIDRDIVRFGMTTILAGRKQK